MSVCAGTEEDEYDGRDEFGLQKNPLQTTTFVCSTSEEGARRSYFAQDAKLIVVISPTLGFAWYFVASFCFGYKDIFHAKFNFIHTHCLGWVYLAWYIVYLTRRYATVNANGARAPARLNRPDQHIYKLMSPKYKDHPYVLMANTGAAGRFNRASRAAVNMDETLHLFLTGLLLNAPIFGPFSVLLALFHMYGGIKFCTLYKAKLENRFQGMKLKSLAENTNAGLVLVCAIKSLFFLYIPF